jgi:hypothetical protein
MRLAASRTFCTAGSKRPIRMPMIAITTSSSINVNAVRVPWRVMTSSGTSPSARSVSASPMDTDF